MNMSVNMVDSGPSNPSGINTIRFRYTHRPKTSLSLIERRDGTTTWWLALRAGVASTHRPLPRYRITSQTTLPRLSSWSPPSQSRRARGSIGPHRLGGNAGIEIIKQQDGERHEATLRRVEGVSEISDM